MQRKIVIWCILFLLTGGTLSAQSLRAYIKAADNAYATKNYLTALVYYKKVIEVDGSRMDIYYKYAAAARQFQSYKIAEEAYQNITESKDARKFPLAYYWLGHVKKSLGKYTEARMVLEDYLIRYKRHNARYARRAEMDIIDCKWAASNMARSGAAVRAVPMGGGINSPYSDFGAFQSGDTLFFSSMRYEDKQQNNRLYSKILMRTSDGLLRELDFSTKEQFAANAALNYNKTRIYYTKCEFDKVGNIKCKIVFRKKDVEGNWGNEQSLPTFINFPGFTTTHPTLGYDLKTEREVLFFTSNRPGGKGKLDIWYSSMAPNGKFTRPINFSKMNSRENEVTPFFHTPSQTLYYSSDGLKGMGGYDIYKVKRKGYVWNAPIHMSYPVNTSYNDFYFSLNTRGNRAFISSNREEAMEIDPENEACCNDIFAAQIIPDPVLATPEEILAAVDRNNPLKQELETPIVMEDRGISRRAKSQPNTSTSGTKTNIPPKVNVQPTLESNSIKTGSSNTVSEEEPPSPEIQSSDETLTATAKGNSNTKATGSKVKENNNNDGGIPAVVKESASSFEELPDALYPLRFEVETFDLELEPLTGTTVEFIESVNGINGKVFRENSKSGNTILFKIKNDLDYKIVLSKPGFYTDTLLIEKEVLTGATSLSQKFYLMEIPDENIYPDSPVIENTKEPEIKEEDLTSYLPIALYFNNNEPDPESWSTTTNKNYEQTFIFYYSKKDKFKSAYARSFPIGKREAAADKVEDFFENKLKQGYIDLADFSKKLLKYLEQGHKVEIQVQSFTNRRSISEGNSILMKRRIVTLKNHFESFLAGQFLPYMDKGLLVIKTLPRGLYTMEKEGSIYSPEHSEIRKIEIKALRF